MVELTRFQNLRPAQWMSGEEVQHTGLSLYPDPGFSPLAKALATAGDTADYSSHIARFREQQKEDVTSSIDSAHSVIRTLYDWLNFKARPIKLKDLEDVVASLTENDLDLEKEWRSYADNLLIAIEGNYLSKNYCVDFQLIIRIFHLVRRALKKTEGGYRLSPDTSEELVEQILSRSIILPAGVIFCRCRMRCSERNVMQLPVPDRQLHDRPICECKCDESCKKPVTHCICIRPYMGDLFLIREKLVRYEAGEIADIENILAGEEKIRRHRMLNRSEETVEVEAETLSSTERDHAVTEKFNLQGEVKNTVDQKTNVDAGVTATFKYGSSITVTPHANVTLDRAKSESRSQARSYAKDIVDRAVTKLEERTRRLQITKTLREIEERNKHTVNNSGAGSAHRAGLYFWVNKITHAQVMNYGRHMMFDMIVPEPAAMFRTLFIKKQAKDDQRKAPPRPDINPALVERDTYGDLLKQFGISSTDELQPPDEKTCIQFAFSQNLGNPESGKAMGFSSHEFKSPEMPAGYRAKTVNYDVRCSTGHPKTTDPKDEVAVSVHVADACIFTRSMNEYADGAKPNQDWTENGQLDMLGEEGTITLAIAGFSSLALSLSGSLSITAELTTEAFEKWQVKIFNTIMDDYNRKLEAYNMAQEARAGLFEIKGRNAFINREIERNEIKRQVIATLICNYFNGMGSMMERVAPCGYPEIDFAKLEKDAPVIQFFEQVFEWEYVTYLFYHSMWARKCKWPELIDENSGDPLFDKFLTAGAARVQVPIRPGMDKIFTWFLCTGQIWGATGQPPLPGDNEYVAMIQELKEARQGDYDERPGLVDVTNGSDVLILRESTYHWDSVNGVPDAVGIANDKDREILINYKVYRIVGVEQHIAGDPTRWKIKIDQPYPDATTANMKHAVGAVFVGAPWEVVIPTQLIYLRNPNDTLPTYPLA